MKSTDVGEINVTRKVKVGKPYVAPKLRRLSPAQVESLLSRDPDTSDKDFRQLIESVNQLHGAKGS
jgi:hypothetical protein